MPKTCPPTSLATSTIISTAIPANEEGAGRCVYFIARLNRHDQFHTRAVEFSYQFHARLITTELILVEVADALAASRCRLQVKAFNEKLASAGVLIVPATSERLQAALDFYHRHTDKQWTLTDCFSFLVMREHGIEAALTGDKHFTQAGFLALLA